MGTLQLVSSPKCEWDKIYPETMWRAKYVPSIVCDNVSCCRQRCNCGGFSNSLAYANDLISGLVHSRQMHSIFTAGGLVGGHGNVLAPWPDHCGCVEGAVACTNGDVVDAHSIDAVTHIDHKHPLRGVARRWRGGTGGRPDLLAHWRENIAHLVYRKWKNKLKRVCHNSREIHHVLWVFQWTDPLW